MTVTYTLKTPVTHGDTTYTVLTFRKPRTGDLVLTDKFQGEMAKTIALLASISDVPIPAFNQIELDDFAGIADATAAVLGNFPEAASGSTS